MHDSRNVTAPCDDATPADITDEQRVAARRTVVNWVAAHGEGTSEATEFMLMLGIFPGQEMETFQVPLTFWQTPS